MQISLKNTLMRNLIKYVIAFYCVFFASDAFSQHQAIKYPLIELKGADTVIIFKIEQGRKLALYNEERKKLQHVVEIQDKQLQQKDSIVLHQSNIIATYKSIDTAQLIIIDEKSKQIELCDAQKGILNQELKKQKRYTWTAIISGITLNIITIWIIQTL